VNARRVVELVDVLRKCFLEEYPYVGNTTVERALHLQRRLWLVGIPMPVVAGVFMLGLLVSVLPAGVVDAINRGHAGILAGFAAWVGVPAACIGWIGARRDKRTGFYISFVPLAILGALLVPVSLLLLLDAKHRDDGVGMLAVFGGWAVVIAAAPVSTFMLAFIIVWLPKLLRMLKSALRWILKNVRLRPGAFGLVGALGIVAICTWILLFRHAARDRDQHSQGLGKSPLPQQWSFSNDEAAGPYLTRHPWSQITTLETRRSRDWYGVHSLSFSPDGRWLAAGHESGCRIWAVSDWRVVSNTSGYRVKFSADGRFFARGCGDSILEISSAYGLPDLDSFAEVRATVFAFSPGGQLLAHNGEGRTVELCSISPRRQLCRLRLQSGSARRIVFSPDGRWLGIVTSEGTVEVWSAQAWSRSASLQGASVRINDLAFAPDGAWMATADQDGCARVWRTEDWQQTRTLRAHGAAIGAIAISDDSKWCVTGSSDNTAKVWRAGGEWPVVTTLKGHGKGERGEVGVTAIAFGADARILATGGCDGPVIVWAVAPSARISIGEASTDWTPGRPEAPPLPVASAQIVAAQPILAGGTMQLEVTASNEKGLGDLFQLKATMESKDTPGWNNRPIFFGRIPAGTARARTVRLPTEVTWPSGARRVRIIFSEINGNAPADVECTIHVVAQPKAALRVVRYPKEVLAGSELKVEAEVARQTDVATVRDLSARAQLKGLESGAAAQDAKLDTLKPGEQRTTAFVFQIPHKQPETTLTVALSFRDADGFAPDSQEFQVAVRALPRAELRISTQLLDGLEGRAGNGDGLLQRGEAAQCRIRLINVGTGTTGALSLKAELPSQTGLVTYGDTRWEFAQGLRPGQSVTADLVLQVQHGFTGKSFPLEIAAAEKWFNLAAERKVTVEVGAPMERSPVAFKSVMVVAGGGANVYGGASKTADWQGKIEEGKAVEVTGLLGDFYRVSLGEGREGWVPADRLAMPPGPKPAPAPKLIELAIAKGASAPPPVVIVSQPQDGTFTASESASVEVAARAEAGLAKVSLFLDDKLVQQSPLSGNKTTWTGAAWLHSGVNLIKVAVVDRAEQEDVQTVRVKCLKNLPSLVGFYEKVWAVVIGIDKYEDRAVPPLGYAVSDARGVERVLRGNFFVSRVVSLYDAEATLDNVRRVLTGELMAAGERDAVLVYWAGHGITVPTQTGPMGYLIPHDGAIDRNKLFKNVSMYYMREEVAKVCAAKDFLLIADACYGGLLTTRGIGGILDLQRDISKDGYLRALRSMRWRGVITAGGPDQQVLDGGPGGHSTFTGPLLEVLGQPGDFLTGSEIYRRVKARVEEISRRQGREHNPHWGTWSDQDGDFVFIPK